MLTLVSRRLSVPALALIGIVALGGCSNMSDTGRRTATGAGIGAAGGALIGSFGANAGWGALAGAGLGAAGGYLYDQSKKKEESAYRRGYDAATPPQ